MDLNHLLQQGAGSAWLFVPTAILLGALHGLEPGHSKTLMAAFIIAVRGTILQAVLLGLSAALSHSLVIWALAAAALKFGGRWSAQASEPYFQIASALMIGGLAAWLLIRTRRELAAAEAHRREHAKEGPHGGVWEEGAAGLVELSIFETQAPARFRVHFYDPGKAPKPPSQGTRATVETRRDGGAVQLFRLLAATDHDGCPCLESPEELPEPHAFTAVLEVDGTVSGRWEMAFSEDGHRHAHPQGLGGLSGEEFADAHEQAHAADIATRFSQRTVTTPQIVWFGITGGLMPCPSAFSVLIVCLQLKRFSLGFALVGSFSLGLAVTMVATGVLAAWALRHAERRFRGFGEAARRAPYASAALLLVLAGVFAVEGFRGLH